MRGLSLVAAALAGFLALSCRCDSDKGKPQPTSKSSGPVTALPSQSAAPPIAPFEPHTRTGSALALSPDEKQLYVVDEDNRKLRVLALPLTAGGVKTIDLPGPPAQIVLNGARVLVTIRQPSLLWIGTTADGELKETARLELPNDAWGIALTKDDQRAVVTSAWGSQVSLVDVTAAKTLWSLPVAREPRGVVIASDQKAYVSHLVGPELTELDLSAPAPAAVRILLPPSPLRSGGEQLSASLGYSLTFDDTEHRLFAPRHALGARGKNAWFGASSVDVWLKPQREPLLPKASGKPPGLRTQLAEELISGGDTDLVGTSVAPFTQPRAVLYRRSTRTLLVAGEGDDRVAELSALAADPTLAVVGVYAIGSKYHPSIDVAAEGAAPAGLSMTRDEHTLFVYCRASNDVVEVALHDPGSAERRAHVTLDKDPLGPGGTTGRKMFYNASDHATSGGLACAGCHPDGRDDGHVWHEATFVTEDGDATIFVGAAGNVPSEGHTQGVPRRTPMLAGRVLAQGPYGWHAESPTILDRETRGFGLHRWGAVPDRTPEDLARRASVIADFLRRGLLPPALPKDSELSEAAKRGRTLFSDKTVGCADCHAPQTNYTTRQAYPLPALPVRPGFDDEQDQKFKIPSLRFLSGRAPYFHDGSATSIDTLIEQNADRMGKTAQLNAEQRADLVAFLRSL